jgi:hypothetical protein
MSPRTRSRLTLCLIVGLIALPAEALLLPVARTPDAAIAAAEWTADLSHADLVSASMEVDAYPLVYRRAIMNRLGADERSTAWRAHFQRYLDQHADLTPEQVGIVQDAIDLATPEAFAMPVRQELKDQIATVFNKATARLGAKAANELFVTPGGSAARVAYRVGGSGGLRRLQLQSRNRHLRPRAGSVARVLGALHLQLRPDLADVRPAVVLGVHGLVQGRAVARRRLA